MSSEPAIVVDGLGKRYHIGRLQKYERTFRQSLGDALTSPLRRIRRLLRGQAHGAADLEESFWALKDVSFEIPEGEVVGIIGRNGAGKSTLLKILSRITSPTEGRAEIRGRLGSLLEVGTGFHPELTGRENAYMNGAILGMGKKEMDRKLDAIVAFAEVEKFIDTPVKHYSSGMYTRLAFSVAAHLEPEILLVDEVLAVGDAAFQKKCLGRMGNIARAGRTVLFVSHNMAAIQTLCRRTLVLEDGRVSFDGPTAKAVAGYLSSPHETGQSIELAPYRGYSRQPVFVSLTVRDESGQVATTFPIGATVHLDLEIATEERVSTPEVTVGINNMLGTRIFSVNPRWQGRHLEAATGRSVVRCTLSALELMPGQYFLKAIFGDGYVTLDVLDDAPLFEIHTSDYFGSGRLPEPISQGVVLATAEWSIRAGDRHARATAETREAAVESVASCGE